MLEISVPSSILTYFSREQPSYRTIWSIIIVSIIAFLFTFQLLIVCFLHFSRQMGEIVILFTYAWAPCPYLVEIIHGYMLSGVSGKIKYLSQNYYCLQNDNICSQVEHSFLGRTNYFLKCLW